MLPSLVFFMAVACQLLNSAIMATDFLYGAYNVIIAEVPLLINTTPSFAAVGKGTTGSTGGIGITGTTGPIGSGVTFPFLHAVANTDKISTNR
ncbi:hypothetical protein D3C87_1437690 [compost metagenome]